MDVLNGGSVTFLCAIFLLSVIGPMVHFLGAAAHPGDMDEYSGIINNVNSFEKVCGTVGVFTISIVCQI